MKSSAQGILACLLEVERLRAERELDKELDARVVSIKAYQATRFERGYADLLDSPRYHAATRFFLDELYGPKEFGTRDAQFAKAVPALVRMLPDELVDTVSALGELHVLTEIMDAAMAKCLCTTTLSASDYRRAWQTCGKPKVRSKQLQLTLEIGKSLERYTRNLLVLGTLRAMRKPALVAGLGELQRFLESGFRAFNTMKGAAEFLEIVFTRETAFASEMFGSECPA